MPDRPKTSPPEGEDPAIALVVQAVLVSSRALVAVSARSIADITGVTLPQYRMLVVLDQAPTNLTALASALDVAPSTALRMIDRLAAAGLVERSTPAENRRETRLALSGAGHHTVATVTERRRRDLHAVIQHIPPDQRDNVAAAMTAFATAAERSGLTNRTDGNHRST